VKINYAAVGSAVGGVTSVGTKLGAGISVGTGLGAVVFIGTDVLSGVFVKEGVWVGTLVGVLVFLMAVGCRVEVELGEKAGRKGTYSVSPDMINSEFPRQFAF
jgi:hypothetical protein